jgi:hypothetical protein
MTYRLTSAQHCVLAECVRSGLVGWMITCPIAGQQSRLLQAKATTLLGFGFSRFATMASNHFGSDFHPSCHGSRNEFPLSISEACALANDVELEMATDDEIHAAALIAAYSPYGQPQVLGRDWRAYVTMLDAVGISLVDADPTWKQQVRDRLRPFCAAVASAHAIAAE